MNNERLTIALEPPETPTSREAGVGNVEFGKGYREDLAQAENSVDVVISSSDPGGGQPCHVCRRPRVVRRPPTG